MSSQDSSIKPEDIYVPIRSVWMLQLYASQTFIDGHISNSSVEEAGVELPELIGTMLCDAVERRFRRELSIDFTLTERNITRVRGQVRWSGVSVLSESVNRGTVSGSVLGSGSGLMLAH